MFRGIFTPMVTIYDGNGEIDKNATRILIEKLIADGVDGIVALGSIGEFFNLSFDEKKEYIQFVTEAVAGRTKVFVGTGSNNIKEVIELNRYSKEHHADAVLIITPYYFNLNEQYVYEYYSTIAKSTELPILLYNFPARTAINLSVDLVLKLAAEFGNIAGIKDTTDSISNVRKFVRTVKKVRNDFCVISGFDEYLIPNLMSGGDGTIGGLSNINAKLFINAYRAFSDKKFEKLPVFQDRINELMELYDLADPFIVALKAATGMALGLEINTSLRSYADEPDENAKKRIREVVQRSLKAEQ